MEKSKLDQFFSRPAVAILFAIAINMVWGCAFPFIKIGYELFAIDTTDITALFVFAGVRFSISGLIVLVGASIVKRKILWFPIQKNSWKILGIALLQTSMQYTLYYIAVSLLTGKIGSLLNTSASFMIVILAHFLYGDKDRMTKHKVLGCMVGFFGVCLACISPDNNFNMLGAVVMLIVAAVSAFTGPVNKAVCRDFDPFLVTGYNLGLGGLLLLLLGVSLGGSITVTSPLAYLDLGVLCFISCFGFMINAILMKNNPVSRIGIFGMCLPITTNIVSAIMFPESYTFGFIDLIAISFVCLGIFLVNKPTQEVTA